MKIIEFHVRTMKIMKILEFDATNTKINKKISVPQKNNGNYENPKITNENHEHHKKI